MVGTPEPLTPVEDRVLQEPYLNYVVIYTVSLKLLYFSVVFTAPANCVEQRAQSCV